MFIVFKILFENKYLHALYALCLFCSPLVSLREWNTVFIVVFAQQMILGACIQGMRGLPYKNFVIYNYKHYTFCKYTLWHKVWWLWREKTPEYAEKTPEYAEKNPQRTGEINYGDSSDATHQTWLRNFSGERHDALTAWTIRTPDEW